MVGKNRQILIVCRFFLHKTCIGSGSQKKTFRTHRFGISLGMEKTKSSLRPNPYNWPDFKRFFGSRDKNTLSQTQKEFEIINRKHKIS